MKDPSAIYEADWFRQHYLARHEYAAVGEMFHEVFGPGSVLDIGCGIGLVLEKLAEYRHDVLGIDGSSHALEVGVNNVRILIRDITSDSLEDLPARDLVICMEIAEHLEEKFSDRLVKTICDHAKKNIFFTAAPNGQGGYDHVNEQPNNYWIEKFEKLGKVYQEPLTMKMRKRLRVICPIMHYLHKNAMVFR